MSDYSISSQAPGQSGGRFDMADYVTVPEIARAMNISRADAEPATQFVLRELTGVYAKTFDVKYAVNKAREIFPTYSGISNADESYLWQQWDRDGAAKIVDSNGFADDAPTSDVFVNEVQARCFSIRSAYKYTIMDLRKAQKTGLPLETRKAFAARRSIENAIEQIAFFGVSQIPGSTIGQGLAFAPLTVNSGDPLATYGFTNFPGLTTIHSSAGTSGAPVNWTTVGASGGTTVAQILADFNSAQLKVVQQSLGVHVPDTAIFPLSIWSLLAATARSPTFTNDSVLQFIQTQSPWLKNVYWSSLLETAGLKVDGSTPGPIVMVCERNSDNFELVMPQEFEQFAPELVNLTYRVNCHARTGGMRISYPKSVVALDQIAG